MDILKISPHWSFINFKGENANFTVEKLEKKSLTMGSMLALLIIRQMDMCLPKSLTERTHHVCSIPIKMHHPNVLGIIRNKSKNHTTQK